MRRPSLYGDPSPSAWLARKRRLGFSRWRAHAAFTSRRLATYIPAVYAARRQMVPAPALLRTASASALATAAAGRTAASMLTAESLLALRTARKLAREPELVSISPADARGVRQGHSNMDPE